MKWLAYVQPPPKATPIGGARSADARLSSFPPIVARRLGRRWLYVFSRHVSFIHGSCHAMRGQWAIGGSPRLVLVSSPHGLPFYPPYLLLHGHQCMEVYVVHVSLAALVLTCVRMMLGVPASPMPAYLPRVAEPSLDPCWPPSSPLCLYLTPWSWNWGRGGVGNICVRHPCCPHVRRVGCEGGGEGVRVAGVIAVRV
jgi:hypothetical protein